ncbi:MAG TPA: pirin family protein [Burkholderiales bacterium]|nr:pirin family protein [Burkholderiales bacterium]
MLEALITPRSRDLGDGFLVRRALPAAERRMVGPFVFFDQMGPAAFHPNQGLAVRPHPHIGLATVTYLFEGAIMHRDSLGSVQAIRPGEVNWMTAGRGIVHSERTPAELRATGSRCFGIQVWVALPREHEETDPAFVHFGARDLPVLDEPGARARVIVGELNGAQSPVPVYSEMFYAELDLKAGGDFVLKPEYAERAAYVAEGEVIHGERRFGAGQMLVFSAGTEEKLACEAPSRVMLLGGEPVGPRFLWWNFVSSSKARIDQAADDWQHGRFPLVPGESESIPLPERPQKPVDYP